MDEKIGVICLLLAFLLPPSEGMSQQPIQWEPTLESAQRVAGQTNRLVLIQFWAPWCVVCRRMDREVLSQPSVAAVLNEKYVPVKINADHFPATARRYGITALPTTVITSPDGQLLESMRGFLDAVQFVERVSSVAAEVQQRRAAVSSQPSGGGAPSATERPAYAGAASATARSDSFQPNRIASSPPAVQPYYSVPGPIAARPSGPAQPPSASLSAATPSRTSPPANAGPANEPSRHPIASSPAVGQSPPQVASAAPVYGTQAPPAVPVQPAVNPSPPPPAFDPPLCLDGYCPVSLCEKQQWVPGDRRWGVIHRGRTYLFVGPEQQRRFFADPDRFAPVGSGNDVVLATEQGRAVPGMREHGVFYGNRVYLFSSEASLAKFAERPEVYANQVLNAIRAEAYSGQHLH